MLSNSNNAVDPHNTELSGQPVQQWLRIGLGWDAISMQPPLDLDVSAFVCGLNAAGSPQLLSEQHLIFYHQLASPDGAVHHSGDHRTGEGDGDDEWLMIDISALDPAVSEVSVVVTIRDALSRQQHFGLARQAYVRVMTAASAVAPLNTGSLLAQYALDVDFAQETALQVGSLMRMPSGGFAFFAVGAGYRVDLADILQRYL
jgi:tellurium resistance protein TerD